jgi:hypothetical protein
MRCLGAAAFVSCSPPRPPLALESEHFRVYQTQPVCPERGEWLEHSYRSYNRYLGLAARAGHVIDYVQYDTSDESHDACGAGQRCAFGDSTIYTDRGADYHELVHVLMSPVGERPQTLEEGLASAIGGGWWASGQQIDPTSEMSEWIVDNGFVDAPKEEVFARYDEAQSFVRYLIDRFGITDFLELYGALPRHSNEETVDRAFREAFGHGLEDTVDGWVASGVRTYAETSYLIPECDAPSLTEVPEPVALTCGPAVGGRNAAVRSFSSDGAQPLLIRSESDTGLGALLVRPCALELPSLVSTMTDDFRATLAEHGLRVAGNRMLLAWLPEARYALHVSTESERPSTWASVSLESATIGSACRVGDPVNLPRGIGEVSIALAIPTASVLWLGLRPEVDVEIAAVTSLGSEGVPTLEPFLCTACDECVRLRSVGVALPAGQVAWIELRRARQEEIGSLRLVFNEPG